MEIYFTIPVKGRDEILEPSLLLLGQGALNPALLFECSLLYFDGCTVVLEALRADIDCLHRAADGIEVSQDVLTLSRDLVQLVAIAEVAVAGPAPTLAVHVPAGVGQPTVNLLPAPRVVTHGLDGIADESWLIFVIHFPTIRPAHG